jgi:hypothetical protein
MNTVGFRAPLAAEVHMRISGDPANQIPSAALSHDTDLQSFRAQYDERIHTTRSASRQIRSNQCGNRDGKTGSG